jgi:predicted sugar kinase
MTVRELVIHEMESLDEQELEYVARIVHSLRTRPSEAPLPSWDPAVYGPLYREFAAEDSRLAEEGIADYAAALAAEDRD